MTQEPTLQVPTSTTTTRQENQSTVKQSAAAQTTVGQAVQQENIDERTINQFQNSLSSQQRLKELEAEVQHYESLVRELKKQMSISGTGFSTTYETFQLIDPSFSMGKPVSISGSKNLEKDGNLEQFQIEITRCQQIISERRTQIRQIINIQTQTEINSTQNTQQQVSVGIVDRDERSERQKLIDEIAELENQLVYLKNKLSFSQNANEMNFTQEHVLSSVHVDVDNIC